MAEDRAARSCGDHVIRDREREGRHIQAYGIVNPQAAEGCASRAGNKLGHNVSHRVGQHGEDDATYDVPRCDVEIRKRRFKERQDELEGHQNEGKYDEDVYDMGKLPPFERLADAVENQHPSGQDYREIPYPKEKPSQLAAPHRPICQTGHNVIKERQESVAQPAKEYALRVVVAKPAPGKPSVTSQKFWKGELCGHCNAEQDRDHYGYE